jgi:transposase
MTKRETRINGKWNDVQLKLAVKAVLIDGKSKKQAAKIHGIPRQTLQDYIRRMTNNDECGIQKKKNGRPTTLTENQELELVDLIKMMADRLYGLSPKVVREVVYNYCEVNHIEHRFNREKKTAGIDWLTGFLHRHPTLSVRVAEATSMQRAVGFNEAKVKRFFDELKCLLFDNNGKHTIPSCNIFNVDETGYTVCHKPGKVLSTRGKRYVGAITSAEKGRTVTAVCCCSAEGVFIPPMLIYPRVRIKPELLDRAPAGAIAGGSKNGWITSELFEKWFDHFLKAVHPEARSEKVLLILDGHSSHTRNINVINKARMSNVVLLSLPSHCTHRLQPLDVAFFKAANTFYDQSASSWLRSHPGRIITENEIAELFKEAYGKAATVKNATSGFEKSGISLFNELVFTEYDFIAAAVTDIFNPTVCYITPAPEVG